MLSYWEFNTFFENIDVTIIGSGIVGLSAALNIKLLAPNLNVLILERGFLPCGASTKNAGFTCFGSPSELLADLQNNSEDNVFSLVEKRWLGLQRLRKTIGDATMDYQQWGGYEIFADDNTFSECADKLKYLNSMLSDITNQPNVYQIDDAKINMFGFKQVDHLIVNSAEGQIDTGKMMSALIRKVQELGVKIINGIEVKNFNHEHNHITITTNQNFNFATQKILIAVNGFAKELLPDFPIYPGRSQVIVTTPITDLKFKGAFHFDQGYYYFRNIGNQVLLGGGRNLDFKGEETCEFGLTDLIQSNLEQHLKNRILPNQEFQIQHRWSGIMGLGNGDKTFIVKKLKDNVYCALRMGGMGIAVGSLVGEEAAQLLLT